MTKRRSRWLWSATIVLWLASLFAGPALLSLPWVIVRAPGTFVEPIYGPMVVSLYAIAVGWLVALFLVGARRSGTMRWAHFAVPVILTILSIFLATIGSNAGVEVSLIPH